MNRKYDSQQKQEAVRLYCEGKTVREVHKLTGISEPYIKEILHKAGATIRPTGFQVGNGARTGKPHSEAAKHKIREAHKASGHAPSPDAVAEGQPKTLIVRWGGHVKDALSQLYRIYERMALKRGLSFELSLEAFRTLCSQDCVYCGSRPASRQLNRMWFDCNGVDRADNSKGYTLDNCVSCCKVCNRMKLAHSSEDFIEHCSRIAAHRGKCQAVA